MLRTRLTALAITFALAATVLVGGSAEAVIKKNLSTPKLPSMVGVGETVAVTPGRWNQSVKVTYQWLADGKPIRSATKTTYKIPVTAMGKLLSIAETAKFKDGKFLTAKSSSKRVGQLAVSGQLQITFKDAQKSALTLTSPNISKVGAAKKITWYAGESLVEGENEAELPVDKRFESLDVTAKVKYSLVGYDPVVLAANTISFDAPSVTANSLIWSDEFNGDTGAGPNLTDWNDVTGNGRNASDPNTPVANGWGNSERQYYLPGSSLVSEIPDADGGKGLLITATKQPENPAEADRLYCFYSKNWRGLDTGKYCEWTSGKLTTEDKIGFLYGHLEARIRTTGTTGTWPAFWMLGQDFQKNGWPGCGEIDIHEGNGALPNNNWGTLHGYMYWPGDKITKPTSMIAEWHVYGMDWKPNYIKFTVDGETLATITADDLKSEWGLDLATNGWEFNKPQFAILNLAIGGKIIGNNNQVEDTKLITNDTKTMQVDYIRYSSLDGYGTLIRY